MKTANKFRSVCMCALTLIGITGYTQNIFPLIGNVGIGTNDPKYTLHLKSTDANAFLIDGSDSLWNGMYITSSTSTGKPFYGYITNGGSKQAYSYLTPAGVWKLFVGGDDRLTVLANGNVGIGTTNPAAPLCVDGLICAKEVRVALSGTPCWPDYVFSKKHNLKSLEEVEQFIKQNQHLPSIPSAKEVETNGVELGNMNIKLLEKIEELTLYLIDMKKENNKLKQRVEVLEKNK